MNTQSMLTRFDEDNSFVLRTPWDNIWRRPIPVNKTALPPNTVVDYLGGTPWIVGGGLLTPYTYTGTADAKILAADINRVAFQFDDHMNAQDVLYAGSLTIIEGCFLADIKASRLAATTSPIAAVGDLIGYKYDDAGADPTDTGFYKAVSGDLAIGVVETINADGSIRALIFGRDAQVAV